MREFPTTGRSAYGLTGRRDFIARIQPALLLRKDLNRFDPGMDFALLPSSTLGSWQENAHRRVLFHANLPTAAISTLAAPMLRVPGEVRLNIDTEENCRYETSAALTIYRQKAQYTGRCSRQELALRHEPSAPPK
jgi:hypothetical protein